MVALTDFIGPALPSWRAVRCNPASISKQQKRLPMSYQQIIAILRKEELRKFREGK
jgi:hypothetical protein